MASVLPQFKSSKRWNQVSARNMNALVQAVQDLQAITGPMGRVGKATPFRHVPMRVVIVKEPDEEDSSLTVRMAGYADIPPDVNADTPYEWKSEDLTAYFDLGNTVEDYTDMWWDPDGEPPEGGLPTLDTVFLDAYYDELTLRVQLPGAGAPGQKMRFKRQDMDYLVCRAWDGENQGENDILVAKEHLLRRKEFDFKLNGGRRRDGVKYTYDEEAEIHWEREAEDKDGWIEKQVIVPPYVTEERTEENDVIGDDIIFVRRDITGGTGVFIEGDPDPVELVWIHKTGREWAQKAE